LRGSSGARGNASSGGPVMEGRLTAGVQVWPGRYRPISVYRLGEMPIQSCGQSVSAPSGKAGARLNAYTKLRTKRQRSAREVIYQNRPIARHVIGCHFSDDAFG